MTKFDIRDAIINDAPALADLSMQFGYPTTPQQSAKRLGAITESREQQVFVACLPTGVVVGWVHVFLALRIESDPFAELGGLVVAEKYRGRGIGRSLLEAAEEWVIHRGIKKLRIRSRSTRLDAHALYERMGYSRTKKQHVFDKLMKAHL